MIGLEQREQTMFKCPDWYLCDQRYHGCVRVLRAVPSWAGQEAGK